MMNALYLEKVIEDFITDDWALKHYSLSAHLSEHFKPKGILWSAPDFDYENFKFKFWHPPKV